MAQGLDAGQVSRWAGCPLERPLRYLHHGVDNHSLSIPLEMSCPCYVSRPGSQGVVAELLEPGVTRV